MTPKEALERIKPKIVDRFMEHDVDVDLVDQSLTELEELKRDVRRYFELINSDEWMGGELENLREEIILKVGNKHE
jgi:hypothetical protein